jgi:hypothetical protein
MHQSFFVLPSSFLFDQLRQTAVENWNLGCAIYRGFWIGS